MPTAPALPIPRIDESRIADFERDGFVLLPGVLDADRVARLNAAGDAAVASDRTAMRQREANALYDGFRNCIDLDPVFVELLAWEPVLPYILRLMGPELHLLTSHLVHKRTETLPDGVKVGRPGWHRDFAKAERSIDPHRMPRLDLKAAYYLNDLPEANCGVTLFWPGSHKFRHRASVPPGQNPAGFVELKLKAGDCVLFENRTWHAGGPNLSPRTRKVVFMGYSYTWVQPSDYKQQRPEVIEWARARFGDIGLQLLGALPQPEGFDYSYDAKPLRDFAKAHGIERVPDPRD